MIGRLLRKMIVSGAAGAAASTIALAAAALAEGKGALQPMNATSHWLNGDRAARRHDLDVRHTGVGLATHIAATFFWATFFEAWVIAQPPKDRADLAMKAFGIAALAAAVDYTITPKRFTPGWELTLTKTSMAFAYAAMAGGFLAARPRV